jgi:hypothetical protein
MQYGSAVPGKQHGPSGSGPDRCLPSSVQVKATARYYFLFDIRVHTIIRFADAAAWIYDALD